MTVGSEIEAFTGTDRMHPREQALLSHSVAQDLGDRYELQAYISRGTFATVWKALDKIEGIPVACKRFEEHLFESANFFHELRTCFRLKHPNIVRIINFLEVPKGPRYLLLEYCEGGTLRRLLSRIRQKGQTSDENLAHSVASHIVQGLSEAHRYGLVHRDLKPENLLRMSNDPEKEKEVIKIADFGLARMLHKNRNAGSRTTMKLSGSPAYMAPEQYQGSYSPSSDLYSMGVILYEMLHGVLPFHGTATELADLHSHEPPKVSDALTPKWRGLLFQLLEKDPLRRPLVDEVKDVLSGMTTTQVLVSSPDPDYQSRCIGVAGNNIHCTRSGERPNWLVISREGIFRFRQRDGRSQGGFPVANVRFGKLSESGTFWAIVSNKVVQLDDELTTVLTLPIVSVRGLAVSDQPVLRIAVLLKDRLLYFSQVDRKEITWTRWLTPNEEPACMAFLRDGTLATTEHNPKLLSLYDQNGERLGRIPLPGTCKQLEQFRGKLLGRLVVENVSRVYGIDPLNGLVELLPKSDNVIHVADMQSSEDRIFGLRSSGEVVRWDANSLSEPVCRFPKQEGPFWKLACDGDQFAALGGNPEPIWLFLAKANGTQKPSSSED